LGIIAAAAAGCSSSPPPTSTLPPIEPGRPLMKAPAFDLASLDASRVRLSDLEGKVTVLYLWSLTRECESDLKLLQALYEKHRGEEINFVGLAWNSGDRSEVAKVMQDWGVTFTTLMCNSQVLADYGVATFPTVFLLNRAGQIRYWQYGILEGEGWDRIIEEALAEGGLAP
jgi:peroxiredoxin